MSFVERSIILCPYLGGSTIGGSTVVIDKFTCDQSVNSPILLFDLLLSVTLYSDIPVPV